MDKEITSILGIDGLPSEKQEEVVNRIEKIILTKLTSKTINKLSPENRKKYTEVLNSGNSEDIYRFISGKIFGFDELITATSTEIVNEFKKKLALK